jgi:prepilin-type N-terminal cleavage/methylation domain-containing protein
MILNLKNNDQGFTLLESLIAILILGILMAGSLAFYYQANTLYYRSLHSQIATWLADSEMEQIKNEGCTAALSDPSTAVTPVSLTGDSSDLSHLTGLRQVTLTCGGTPNDVAVSVTWTEIGEPVASNNHTVILETYVGS